jgi:hypothetical protein
MRRSWLLSLVPLAVTASCVIVDPSCSRSSAAVIVSPTVVVVAVGQSFTPSASERGCDGRYNHSSPRWSLANAADSAYVRVNASTGEITGRRAGRATVAAESTESGSVATVDVTVH